jgi:hypothetical protein
MSVVSSIPWRLRLEVRRLSYCQYKYCSKITRRDIWVCCGNGDAQAAASVRIYQCRISTYTEAVGNESDVSVMSSGSVNQLPYFSGSRVKCLSACPETLKGQFQLRVSCIYNISMGRYPCSCFVIPD